MTAYRCREHPDYPVSFKGTGCRACAHEQLDADHRRRLRDVPDWAQTESRNTPDE